MKEKILEVKNLEVSFKTYAGISHAETGTDYGTDRRTAKRTGYGDDPRNP